MTDALDAEALEFRQMVRASIAMHVILLASIFAFQSFSSSHPYIDASSPGPISVMWARPVGGAEKTAPNKLPGPIVPITAPPAANEKPKIVMPEEMPKNAIHPPPKELDEDAARKKAMADALARIGHDVDARPIPRPENFPSEKTTGKGGYPGVGNAQGSGIVGALGGNPLFSAYRSQIQRIMTDNFLWLQKEQKLHAEVMLRIDASGTITTSELSKSSGNLAYDRAALRAVQKSSPLPPPPDSLAKDIVRQDFVINFVR